MSLALGGGLLELPAVLVLAQGRDSVRSARGLLSRVRVRVA
jgi:hypothetical protein